MKRLVPILLLLALTPPACVLGDSSFVAATSFAPIDNASSGVNPLPPVVTPPPPAPTATPAPNNGTTFKALWSGKYAGSDEWTGYAQTSLAKYGDDLLAGPADVTDFCPNFSRMTTNEKIDFYVQFLAAMTRYESNFDPTLRYTESSMGTDPVTGVQVVSEGLLQLSYVDEQNYRAVVPAGTCDFDYQTDKQYPLRDVRRSIQDPNKNLTCAIVILNRQVERYDKLAVSSGAYWAVIKTDRSTNKLQEIKAITKALPFCQ